MYYTAYGLVNSPEPRVQPLLPDDAAPPAARPDAAAPISGRGLATVARDCRHEKPPEERLRDRGPRAHAAAATPTPDERTRQTKRRGGVRAGAARWPASAAATITALAQQRAASGVCQGPGVGGVRTRRRGGASSSSRPTAGGAWDATLKCYCSRTCEGRAPRTTRSTGSSILSEMCEARRPADAGARARGAPWPRACACSTASAAPVSCGACVAADCGGAPCRDHARPGLQKRDDGDGRGARAFDAPSSPVGGCVPPCPRCGASAGHAAPPQSAPRLYRSRALADGGRPPSAAARALRAAAVREGGCDGDAARAAAAVGARACAGTENDEASVAAFCRARAALRAAPGAAFAALVAACAPRPPEDDAVCRGGRRRPRRGGVRGARGAAGGALRAVRPVAAAARAR